MDLVGFMDLAALCCFVAVVGVGCFYVWGGLVFVVLVVSWVLVVLVLVLVLLAVFCFVAGLLVLSWFTCGL